VCAYPIIILTIALACARPAAGLELQVWSVAVTDSGAVASGPSVVINRIAAGPIRVTATAGGFVAGRIAPTAQGHKPSGALLDTKIAVGSRDIARAWLSSPTVRYAHGVLGDAVEAEAVVVELRDGSAVEFNVGPDAVIEDRIPRLVDLDGDGRDKIMVVRSGMTLGAGLILLGVEAGELVLKAEALPIGTAHRWLNPVGVADFDGDGVREAAVVVTPHIGGRLQLYEWRGKTLTPDHAAGAEVGGFSNHVIGSRELGLAALADLDGYGVTDIVLPDAARGALVGVTFAGGKYRELFRLALPHPVATSLATRDLDGDGRPEIVFGLRDGTVMEVSARP
jgi:hypothetical protein